MIIQAKYHEFGDVYFRVTKIKEYGMLSGIKVEDLIAGASERVDDNDKKEKIQSQGCLFKKNILA